MGPGLPEIYRRAQVTVFKFILPSNSNTECEFKFSKNLRRTNYLFAIYQTSRIRISINK
jgi:hypothetical protein